MRRLTIAILGLLALTACTNANDLSDPPVPLGRFALGHNVVVAPELVKGPLSRDASKEEWIEAVRNAMDARFGRYEGDKFYHLAISVEGYVLAQPGIPLILSPKSILIIRATVWDDALGKKMNEEAHQITVFESFSPDTIIGSGLTKSKEEQMQALAANAAKAVQNWMLTNPEWFEIDPEAAAAALAEAEAEEAARAEALAAAEAAAARQAAEAGAAAQ